MNTNSEVRGTQQLALCVALSVDTVAAAEGAHAGDALAEAVGLDMAHWWEVSAEGYLRHVPKARILAAVEAAAPAKAAALGKLKKDELVVEGPGGAGRDSLAALATRQGRLRKGLLGAVGCRARPGAGLSRGSTVSPELRAGRLSASRPTPRIWPWPRWSVNGRAIFCW